MWMNAVVGIVGCVKVRFHDRSGAASKRIKSPMLPETGAKAAERQRLDGRVAVAICFAREIVLLAYITFAF